MGMRRNIALSYEKGQKVYFYTHWGASTLHQTLAKALKFGKARWADYPYLARIIFSRMIQNDVLDETGYGIAPYIMDDEYPTIEVDFVNQTVNGVSYQDFINNPDMFALK